MTKKVTRLDKTVDLRKQAEEVLQESDGILSRLFMLSPAAISISTLPEGRFVEVNDRLLKILGYSREEMIGKTGADINLWVDTDTRERIYSDLSTNGYFLEMENRYRCRDGHIISTLASGHIIDIQGKTYLIAMTQDITDRKRGEEKLRDSEEKYRILVENANDMILVAQDEKLKFTNRKGEQILRRSKEEIMAVPFVNFIHPDDRDMVMESHRKRMEGQLMQEFYPFRIIDGEGNVKWVEIRAINISWEGRPATLNFFTDVTERKQAQKTLRESEEKYRLIAENTADLISITDMNMRRTYVSPASMRLHGFTVEEALEQTPEQILTPDSLRLCLAVFAEEMQIEAGGRADPDRTRIIEVEEYKKDGSTIWVEVSLSFLRDKDGKPTEIIMVTRDISDRKRADEALAKSEEKLRLITGNMSDCVALVDASGKYQYATSSYRETLGYDPREMIGIKGFSLIHPDDVERIFKLFMEAFEKGWHEVNYETRLRHKDGHYVPMEIRVRSLNDAQGKIIGGVLVARDITKRLQLEQERERAEEESRKLASIVRHSRELVNLATPNGTMIFLNDAGKKMLGIPEENVDKTYIMQVIPENLRDKVRQEVLPAISRDGYWEGDLQYLNLKTGVLTDVHAITYKITDPNTGEFQFLANVSLDITERKRAEDTLHLFKDLVEHSSDAIGMSTPEGRHYYQNEAFNRIFGDIGELPVETVYVNKKIGKEVFDTIMGGGSWQGEVKMFKKDKTILDIFLRTYSILNQNGRIIGLVGLHTDITERKRAEEALKESEERFRNLSNASLEGIMIHDHGVILDVNMAFVLLFGYEQPEDLIGKNGPDLLLNPESQARIRQRMQQQEIGPIDVIGIRKNGTTFYGETESQKIKYLGQDVRIVSCRDITERKQAEEELKISREQLIKADKMIALGTLVAGVAHEINNPNNFVMLNAPLIQEVWKGISPVLEEYYRENGDFKAGGMSYSKMREGVPILLNGIMEGTRRISSIVKELKDFAKPDDTYMNQQVDINAVVKGAVNLLQNVISKATDLFSVTYGEKLSEVIGNFQRLEQVVINIVHNACQALPDKTKGIAVITSCDDQSIIVRVTDEGQGIPQEYLNQIMDPFFTKKQGSGGMGLGLSISQKIVIDHGGHIDVESTEGKGSTFTIFLPRA